MDPESTISMEATLFFATLMLHVCNQLLKRISNNGSIIGNLAAVVLAKREVLLIRTSAGIYLLQQREVDK